VDFRLARKPNEQIGTRLHVLLLVETCALLPVAEHIDEVFFQIKKLYDELLDINIKC